MPRPELDRFQLAFGRYGWRLVLLALLLGYSYGWLSERREYFPTNVVDRAVQALQALRPVPNDNFHPSQFAGSGVLRSVPEKMAPGMTFVSLFRDGSARALLLDKDGHVRHEWHVLYSQLWEHPPQEIRTPSDDRFAWHGAYLFPNGDIVVNFEGDGFPYGGGLVRLDKNSRVIWKLPRNTHHSLDIAEDGSIWVASQKWLGEGESALPHFWKPHYEDYVLQLSPDGKVLREINVLAAIMNSNYRGLLPAVQGVGPEWHPSLQVSEDPTHLNSVDYLDEVTAPDSPFAAGDILVSLRNLQAICVIDKDTGIVKWATSGYSVMQHSTRFTPDGHIILMDNDGATPALDKSRIIEIDPTTPKMVWSYDHDLDTGIKGTVRVLPNNNVLIAEAERGRVLEVTRSHEIVWEWVNGLGKTDEQGRPLIGVVELAARIPPSSLGFLDNAASANEEPKSEAAVAP